MTENTTQTPQQTLNTELYKIGPLGRGALSVMPKPTSEQLEHDIQFYQSQGVTKVVSVLLPKEVIELDLSQEEDTCEKQGVKFAHFPIKDMSVPTYETLQPFLQELKQDLENGEHLTIHCHGGRGRAGIVAITLMIEHGYDADLAIQIASEARGDNMPVNDIQLAFVKAYQCLD